MNNFLHDPEHAKRVHCIGIGGIGVSALAFLLIEKNVLVTGTDEVHSEITNSLQREGALIEIKKHPKPDLPKETQLIVYSPAVPYDHPQRIEARQKNITEVSYPEMLGHLMKSKISIAVSGTHGKTTTTALIGYILTSAGFDPTVIVGALVPQFKEKNYRLGKSEFMVVEADEYKESFLQLKPTHIVLTTIEEDHLDYYRNISHIVSSFSEYVIRLPKNGSLTCCPEDSNTNLVLEKINMSYVAYGEGSENDYSFDSVRFEKIGTIFKIKEKNSGEGIEIFSPLTGIHNVNNVTAAFSVCRSLGVQPQAIAKAIKSFKGVWRRFDIKKAISQVTILDDYAHHPTEIKALINSMKQRFPKKHLLMVYQPHQDNRFTKLFEKFCEAFDGLDKLYLMEIYHVAGRQEDHDTSKRLLPFLEKRGVNAQYIATEKELLTLLLKEVKKNDIISFAGAGDIINTRSHFEEQLKKNKPV